MTKQELKFAQNDVYNAGKHLCSAGLRLNGSKYYSQYRAVYEMLNELNRALIKDINGK